MTVCRPTCSQCGAKVTEAITQSVDVITLRPVASSPAVSMKLIPCGHSELRLQIVADLSRWPSG